MDKAKVPKIRFRGQEYALIGGNVIATPEQFARGDMGFAYIENGRIMRYGQEIGHIEDIECLGEEIEIEATGEGVGNMISQILDILDDLLGDKETDDD